MSISPNSTGRSSSVVFPEPLAPAMTLYGPTRTLSFSKLRYLYASMRVIMRLAPCSSGETRRMPPR